jgi:hypothetical protein
MMALLVPKDRKNARIAHAPASCNVAIEKSYALAGSAKDACVSDAKARYSQR